MLGFVGRLNPHAKLGAGDEIMVTIGKFSPAPLLSGGRKIATSKERSRNDRKLRGNRQEVVGRLLRAKNALAMTENWAPTSRK